jgi:hypothetical protein
MATWETVCEIVSALPGTELDPPPATNPAWRVKGNVLARRNPRLRVPDEEPVRRARGELVAIRVDRDEREFLVRQDPETFFITPHWETSPFVLVWLATARTEQLRELVIDAWRAQAPKRLLRELEGRF